MHRQDRRESFLSAHPNLQVEWVSAVYGKDLILTSEMYNIFKNNTFQWNKAIIGCVLSHLALWKHIASSKNPYHVILEDDVRLEKGWETWNNDIPPDAELLYIGGVLPPNRSSLSLVTKSVNSHWSCILPNTYFSSTPASIFHFCTYSYIITPKGAQKLLDSIHKEGIKLPCDHHLIRSDLKQYVHQPLLATCYQDNDPIYCQASFNNTEKVFDTDIQGEKDCFDISAFTNNFTLYYMSDSDQFSLYERLWLEDIIGKPIQCESFHKFNIDSLSSIPFFLVQRPHLYKWNQIFRTFLNHNIPFKVIHLSDEFATDDISFYSFPNCRGVLRNYIRQGIPELPHIVIIPLGYHHRSTLTKPIKWTDRKYKWSFHGTEWFNRRTLLEPFQEFVPFHCHLQPSWNHPSSTSEHVYLSSLENSQFCPIMRGNHCETFRLYEALEAGTLPITTIVDEDFLTWCESNIDFGYNWRSLDIMRQVITEDVSIRLRGQWEAWKERIRRDCQKIINL